MYFPFCNLALKRNWDVLMLSLHCVSVLSILSRGSSVFMVALDAKKAFDHLNHVKLFHQMCDVGIPV